MLPKISVITPSFNQGEYLEQTIRSVVDQQYPNLEYIIIDGGSTDDSLEIIHRYSGKLTYWESEVDNGQSHAINKGFARATGEIIAYLNSDDLYCPGALHVVGQFFAQHPETVWLCGNVLFSNQVGQVYVRKRPVFSSFILRNGSSSVYQPSVFLRRSVLDEIGYLRVDFHAIMDREWFCRIAERYSPRAVDVDLAIFRWHPASKSTSGRDSGHHRRYLTERVLLAGRSYPYMASLFERYPKSAILLLEQIARLPKAVLRLKRYLFGNL
jgi:glycosyltransferase involved in cell wall biosynthesis